jgi:hypothetical protein
MDGVRETVFTDMMEGAVDLEDWMEVVALLTFFLKFENILDEY